MPISAEEGGYDYAVLLVGMEGLRKWLNCRRCSLISRSLDETVGKDLHTDAGNFVALGTLRRRHRGGLGTISSRR